MAKSYDKEFNYIIGKRVSCLAKAKETNNKEMEKKTIFSNYCTFTI